MNASAYPRDVVRSCAGSKPRRQRRASPSLDPLRVGAPNSRVGEEPILHSERMTADAPGAPPLQIPRDIHDDMVAHCLANRRGSAAAFWAALHRESRRSTRCATSRASETRYDADPRDLIDAVVALRHRGAEILAIYHSHPRWEAVPSQTDLRENHYGPVPRIIVSLKTDLPEVRVWQLDPDSFVELAWQIIEPAGQIPCLRLHARPLEH